MGALYWLTQCLSVFPGGSALVSVDAGVRRGSEEGFEWEDVDVM